MVAGSAPGFAPIAKNSIITSKGMPFVSGTFMYTNNHEMMHPTTNNVKTPVRPRRWSKKGNEDVTIKVLIQNVSEHMEMHIPRTLVGKISEHTMLGITPRPMQKMLS